MSTDNFRVIWSFVGYDEASQSQDKVWVAQTCTISLDVCGGSTLFFSKHDQSFWVNVFAFSSHPELHFPILLEALIFVSIYPIARESSTRQTPMTVRFGISGGP